MEFTPALLASVIGFIVSFAMEYLKIGKFDFAGWYNALTNAQKKLVAAGIGLLVVVVAFAAGCANLVTPPYWACTFPGAKEALAVFIAYFAANQTTFAILFNRGK